MRVKYVGPIDRVAVSLPNGRQLEVERLEVVELRDVGLSAADADAVGKALIRGGEWEVVREQRDKQESADEAGGGDDR